jgi:O-antigen/teichoic acid export membrane protein
LLASLAALGVAFGGGTLGWIVAAGAGVNLLSGVAAFLYARRRHAWAFQAGNFFDGHQIKLQLRTGAKSFGFQIGAVLLGTAPVLAISSQAGPEFVPLFTVPLTLITLPLSFLAALNANLQAGYGEAFAAGDHAWIAGTLRKIIVTSLLLMLPMAVGHALLAGPFIELWTRGRLAGETLAIASALAVGIITSFLSTARFALSGVNRHRQAALGEIINGLLALTLAPLLVKLFGYKFVGAAIVLATLATSGWILPRELMRHLSGMPLWPSASVVIRLVLAAALSAALSFWLWQALTVAPVLRMLIVGTCVAGVYFGVLWLIAREQLTPLVALARRVFNRPVQA